MGGSEIWDKTPWVLHWKWVKVLRQNHVKFPFSMQQEWHLSQISLFPVNSILVHISQDSVQSSPATGLSVPTNVLLCTKRMSTLIVALNFTIIPTLFLCSFAACVLPSHQWLCNLLCTKNVSTLIITYQWNFNYNFSLLPVKYRINSTAVIETLHEKLNRYGIKIEIIYENKILR